MTEKELSLLRKKLMDALEKMTEEELSRIWDFIFSEGSETKEGESR